MYAVVNLAGKQFTVRPDGQVRVPHLDAEVGSVIRFDDVLLFSDGDDVRVGRPRVDGVTVTAEVIDHGRERKILVFKKKRRKNYRRTKGHRQEFTLLRIKEISG